MIDMSRSRNAKALVSGQRLDIGESDDLSFSLSGPSHTATLVAVSNDGAVTDLEQSRPGRWLLRPPSPCPERLEVVAYLSDDRMPGSMTDLYPINVVIGGRDAGADMPKPQKPLRAVILAEVYVRGGARRVRIGGDGFAYGPDAYARARGIDPSSLPRRRDADPPTSGQSQPPVAGGIHSSGSSVIVAPGTIITNAHVIDGGSRFLAGSRRTALELLCVDPIHDLALLRGDVTGEPIRIRSDSTAWLGEPVVAAGYPLMTLLGADLKVSMGNVSGLVGSHGDVSRFQFTAPVGSGSSGGAVVDEFGNLIGVTAASLAHAEIRDHGSTSENVNFAVKASLVREMLGSVGIDVPDAAIWKSGTRKDVVARLRAAVVSIVVGS